MFAPLLLFQSSPFDPRCTQELEFDFHVFIVLGLKPLQLLPRLRSLAAVLLAPPGIHPPGLDLQQSHLGGEGSSPNVFALSLI